MMGKALLSRPPHFRECSICHREFGSRSLEIHMGRCLDLQRTHQQILSSGKNLGIGGRFVKFLTLPNVVDEK